MDVCKRTVPLRHGGTLNNRPTTSPLVRLVEREERWEAREHSSRVFSLKIGVKPSKSVMPPIWFSSLRLTAVVKIQRLAAMNFVGLDVMLLSISQANGNECVAVQLYEKDIQLGDNRIVKLSLGSPPGGATAYQLLRRSINRQVANRVTKNDANLALLPTF
ncbi:hypothetical protein TNCV_2270901 [Trichonephila clavipes]|nr:hypothetical protein TNCV_2270901 [Trichonephila clavipes]